MKIDSNLDDDTSFCYSKDDSDCPFSALKEFMLSKTVEDDDEKYCVVNTLSIEFPIKNFDPEKYRLGLDLDDAIDYDIFNVKMCDESVCDTYDMPFFDLEKVSIGKIMLDLVTLETFDWH